MIKGLISSSNVSEYDFIRLSGAALHKDYPVHFYWRRIWLTGLHRVSDTDVVYRTGKVESNTNEKQRNINASCY
jgi:hypothetical protein